MLLNIDENLINNNEYQDDIIILFVELINKMLTYYNEQHMLIMLFNMIYLISEYAINDITYINSINQDLINIFNEVKNNLIYIPSIQTDLADLIPANIVFKIIIITYLTYYCNAINEKEKEEETNYSEEVSELLQDTNVSDCLDYNSLIEVLSTFIADVWFINISSWCKMDQSINVAIKDDFGII